MKNLLFILLFLSSLMFFNQSRAGHNLPGFKTRELKSHDSFTTEQGVPFDTSHYNKSYFSVPKFTDHRSHVFGLINLQAFHFRRFGNNVQVNIFDPHHVIPFGRRLIFPNHYFW